MMNKEWEEMLEWFKRNPEHIAKMKKIMSELEFPTPKKYRDWSVQEVYEDLKNSDEEVKGEWIYIVL